MGFTSPNSSQNQSLWHARLDNKLGRPDCELFLCLKSNSENFSNFGRPSGRLDVQTFLLVIQTIKLQYFLLAFQ
jgi:hypothetical protein